ncbi:hypothetical protein DSO57_1037553 [Entomophthora muscae]|uniref:Uncharacterized protein n=1 Tax=Entomophthora muscae TaxID=34485 RepID=A0ACC2SZ85_9FUNG|nr:hypothetical protein DSO57_1037553 [Entomophthora muscae]
MDIAAFNLVLNSVSAVLGLVTVGLVLGLDRGNLAQRVSVRFTLAIAWVDVFKAVSIILYSVWKTGGLACKMVGFILVWGFLGYMFLNGMLALNLYLVFVRGKVFSEAWTKYYFSCGLGMASVLAGILLALDKFGWDDDFGVCEFKDSNSAGTYALMWLCFIGWILVVCVFNLVVIILALHKLWSRETRICPTHRHLKSLVLRV